MCMRNSLYPGRSKGKEYRAARGGGRNLLASAAGGSALALLPAKLAKPYQFGAAERTLTGRTRGKRTEGHPGEW